MTKQITLFLLLLFASQVALTGQTIISNDLRIDDPEQLHVLYTTGEYQFMGTTRFIRNDSVGFQIRNTEEIRIFLFNEITFLGLFDEAFVQTTPAKVRANTLTDKDFQEQYPLPLNQLLYSATAIPYRSRGVYRNTMLLVNQLDYQPDPHFGISGGVFVPALISARLKTQLSASDILHLGLAVEHNVVFFDEQASTHPYAIVTLGKREKYLNFTLGYWIDHIRYNGTTNTYPMVTLGASFNFAPGWRFYVDGAAVFQTFNNLVLPSFHFTNQRRKGALEFGVVALPESSFPLLPLLTYQRVF